MAKPGLVTVTADTPVAPPTELEPQDQKVEDEAVVVEEVKLMNPETASSDSESEEEAEYQPNVPASISQSQIPEENEEEEEQMKEEEKQLKEDKEEQQAFAPALPVEVSQPAEEVIREEELKQEDRCVEEKKGDQEERESGRETEDSTDDPMVTPEEAPEGLMPPEEATMAAPTEEQEQPKMNGEASLVEADPRPQVICCSEVKPTAELLQGLSLPASRRNTLFFPRCSSHRRFPFSCLCEALSPMYILTLISVLLGNLKITAIIFGVYVKFLSFLTQSYIFMSLPHFVPLSSQTVPLSVVCRCCRVIKCVVK